MPPSAVAAAVPGAFVPRALALLAQFLSPRTNLRSDRYGGDASSRLRLVLEVIAAVRGAMGGDRALRVKLNSADFQRGGFDEQASRDVITQLAGAGVDLIEISCGTFEAPAMMAGPGAASKRRREAYFLEYAERARDAAGDVSFGRDRRLPDRRDDGEGGRRARATSLPERPVPARRRRHAQRQQIVVRAHGEFLWHEHDDTDDLFLVLSGRLIIQLRRPQRDAPGGRAVRRPPRRRALPTRVEEAHVPAH